MMVWNLLLGVAVAVFSVFGVACAVQMLVEACFPLRQIVTVVEIRTPQDRELLETLLREAKSGFFQKRSARLGVHLSESLCEDGRISEDILKILRKYHADCYLAE